jgi:hypothetical protein
MKPLFLLFLLAFAWQGSTAQQSFSEGSITYGISLNADNPMASMFEGSFMRITFGGQNARVDVKMAGGMVDMVTATTPKNGVIMVNAGGKKIATKLDKKQIKELEAEEAQKPATDPKDIEILKDVTEIVAGYPCYLVRVRRPEFEEPMDIYVTEAITPQNQTQIQKQFPGVKGMPLKYTVKTQGMGITFKAKEISPGKPKKDAFKVEIPKGYEVMKYEDFKAMAGKGAGGMFGM